MTDVNDLINDANGQAKGRKGSKLAVNEQTAQTTQLSVASSAKAGESLAVKEAQAFALGYAEASQAIAETLETEIDKIRNARNAAIASVPVKTNEAESDFLAEFKQGLSSLLAPKS